MAIPLTKRTAVAEFTYVFHFETFEYNSHVYVYIEFIYTEE